jgi:cysteine-rich repeat protein
VSKKSFLMSPLLLTLALAAASASAQEFPLAVCGNETVEIGEQCDDANSVGGDGCSASCQLEGEGPGGSLAICGNELLEAGEQCDDANAVNGDGCSATCEIEGPDLGEGCTPGYWKQRQHFDSWVGYNSDALFSSVFEDAFPGETLLDVLNRTSGGLSALGRHAVAALLNTSSGDVNYGQTPQDIIDAFNATFPGDDVEYEALKNSLSVDNERGCPLD